MTDNRLFTRQDAFQPSEITPIDVKESENIEEFVKIYYNINLRNNNPREENYEEILSGISTLKENDKEAYISFLDGMVKPLNRDISIEIYTFLNDRITNAPRIWVAGYGVIHRELREILIENNLIGGKRQKTKKQSKRKQ